MKQHNSKKLKRYLSLNSLFSGICGLIMSSFPNAADTLFATGNTYIFSIIGANLILFAAFVWYVSKKQLNKKTFINLIVIADVLWVAGSIAIIFFTPVVLSKTGYIIICIVALLVGFLAYKQNKYK